MHALYYSVYMSTKPEIGRPQEDEKLIQITTHIREDQNKKLKAYKRPGTSKADLIRDGIDLLISKRECMHSSK